MVFGNSSASFYLASDAVKQLVINPMKIQSPIRVERRKRFDWRSIDITREQNTDIAAS